jgi:putative transcriptional regulator
MIKTDMGKSEERHQYFANHFLISLSRLTGDYFHSTVTLILQHNAEGAFGLVINRPLDAELDGLIEDMPAKITSPVFEGGPVEQTRLFFLHSDEKSYSGSLDTGIGVILSSSDDLISDLKKQMIPEHLLPVIGYAGWGPGQLENELIEDAWLITPATREIIFETAPSNMAEKAAALFGIDLNLYHSTTSQS